MDSTDLGLYRHDGHVSVNGAFTGAEMQAVARDIEQWDEAFLADLPAEQRAWYLDGGVKARAVLRKLDNPHAPRAAVQAHQDNFYFGPTDIEGVVTAWIALADATPENGRLYFGDGTNLGPLDPHFAPDGEPFNLQLPSAVLDKQPMTPAPVRMGSASFHHGNTLHPSGPNHSERWRRACARHYVRNGVEFARPAMPDDTGLKLKVS